MDQVSPIRLSNSNLEIRLDAGTGRILAVRNLARDLDLLSSVEDMPPWRVEIEGQPGWLHGFRRFSFTPGAAPGQASGLLRWETDYGFTLTSRISLPENSDTILLTFAVENGASSAIDKVEYPILSGIGPLTREGIHTHLVHSQGTGFLFHDPLLTFAPENGPRQGLRYSPYPEGFNGSTMQFMAYYAQDRGGFYFATRDAGKNMKWFNFYRDVDTALLVASIMHQAPVIEAGASFSPPYEIEISALYQGNWYEAAERYKTWAVQQSWTRQGALLDRQDLAAWLLKEVGICTFGVNAAFDRSAWLQAFHQMAGTPVLHILGPNWAHYGQDYMNHLPGGDLSEWLPAHFSEANLAAIRRNLDRWVPFEFDTLASHSGANAQPVLESRQVLPVKKYSFDRYLFPFMCPATAFWHDFHVNRDAALVRDNACDGVYYDISANNMLMACRSRSHAHQPGGGEAIAGAFARMFAATKDAMAQAAQKYVPIGTEMITELLIPEVDFYQARAEASPSSAFEADFWRSWIVEGKAAKIPLFAYVYHEYGPVRMDGWAKLAAEAGDIFYWVASRVTLWGGLFELNYEFSALETLDGRNDDPAQHYYHFEPRHYAIDPGKAAFVGEVARARAGWANDYLAYGVMLRPPEVEAPSITLNYHLYNCGKDFSSYDDKGAITVPSVVCSAWRYRDERAAIFFSNLLETPQTVQVALDPQAYALKQPERLQLYRLDREGSTLVGALDHSQTLSLDLPSRKIIALELRPG